MQPVHVTVRDQNTPPTECLCVVPGGRSIEDDFKGGDLAIQGTWCARQRPSAFCCARNSFPKRPSLSRGGEWDGVGSTAGKSLAWLLACGLAGRAGITHPGHPCMLPAISNTPTTLPFLGPARRLRPAEKIPAVLMCHLLTGGGSMPCAPQSRGAPEGCGGFFCKPEPMDAQCWLGTRCGMPRREPGSAGPRLGWARPLD